MNKIEITFARPVELNKEERRRLTDIAQDICDRERKPDEAFWVCGWGAKPIWSKADAAFMGVTPEPNAPEDGEPAWDDNIFTIECASRPSHPSDAGCIAWKKDQAKHDAEAAEKRLLEAAIDRMGWDEIRAFRDELVGGQDALEDAGGFFIRGIKRLFGFKPSPDQLLQTYKDAAREMVATAYPRHPVDAMVQALTENGQADKLDSAAIEQARAWCDAPIDPSADDRKPCNCAFTTELQRLTGIILDCDSCGDKLIEPRQGKAP